MDKYDHVDDVPYDARVSRIFRTVMTRVAPKVLDSLQSLDLQERWALSRANARLAIERLQIVYCKIADRDHHEKFHWHAHSFHVPGFICVAREINSLKGAFVISILLHEVGHVLGGETDHLANRFVYEVLGVDIEEEGGAIKQVNPYELGFSAADWNEAIAKTAAGVDPNSGWNPEVENR